LKLVHCLGVLANKMSPSSSIVTQTRHVSHCWKMCLATVLEASKHPLLGLVFSLHKLISTPAHNSLSISDRHERNYQVRRRRSHR
ncbi:hypothetical protein KCU83_g648, partial [Aureobasidium melanogenum]